MIFLYKPDKQLFDEGVLMIKEENKELRCNLFGLITTDGGKDFIPPKYKSILSYKNGFARAIDLAGRLIYISDSGEIFFNPELPFIQELCEDFDEEGKAKVTCLIDTDYIVSGYLKDDGELLLKS